MNLEFIVRLWVVGLFSGLFCTKSRLRDQIEIARRISFKAQAFVLMIVIILRSMFVLAVEIHVGAGHILVIILSFLEAIHASVFVRLLNCLRPKSILLMFLIYDRHSFQLGFEAVVTTHLLTFELLALWLEFGLGLAEFRVQLTRSFAFMDEAIQNVVFRGIDDFIISIVLFVATRT